MTAHSTLRKEHLPNKLFMWNCRHPTIANRVVHHCSHEDWFPIEEEEDESLLRKADEALADSRSWRKSLLAPCFAYLPEDLVKEVMTYWSPDYPYMDELKEFGWDGDRREHIWAYLKDAEMPEVGETLSQSPCVWNDGNAPDDDPGYQEWLRMEENWGMYGEDGAGISDIVGWKTRHNGVYYSKEVQVKRDLQLGWNRV